MLKWEGGGGYALIYLFSILRKIYNIIIGRENVGTERRGLKLGIWEQIKAPKIWNQEIEAQKIWNQGIYGYP